MHLKMHQDLIYGVAIHNKPSRLVLPPHDCLEIEFLPDIVLPNFSDNHLEPALFFGNDRAQRLFSFFEAACQFGHLINVLYVPDPISLHANPIQPGRAPYWKGRQ